MTEVLNCVSLCLLYLWYRDLAERSRVLERQADDIDVRWRKYEEASRPLRGSR